MQQKDLGGETRAFNFSYQTNKNPQKAIQAPFTLTSPISRLSDSFCQGATQKIPKQIPKAEIQKFQKKIKLLIFHNFLCETRKCDHVPKFLLLANTKFLVRKQLIDCTQSVRSLRVGVGGGYDYSVYVLIYPGRTEYRVLKSRNRDTGEL